MRLLAIYILGMIMLLHNSAMAVTRMSSGRTTVSSGRGGTTAASKRVVVKKRYTNASENRAVVMRSGTKTKTVDAIVQNADSLNTCKTQYTKCMDNFCNVLDDNLGRCSCSPNIKNYSDTEAALKQATEELQDVAQKIQYIGLSADEVEALFSQTEAELKMSSTSDSTQIKNELDRIRKMIVDIKSGTASSVETGVTRDLSGLLDFSVSSTVGDVSSLFRTSSNSNASVSNQRGEQLYKTAAARCKASVLNSCSKMGVDVSLITNSYDMEIDRQCISYERNLADKNKQMVSTVRNAKSVLQKARLMVGQRKNIYDLRGCVNALDACMRDDFVCGSDYENCLDSTGKLIVKGAVVAGAVFDNKDISDNDISALLRSKIGTIDAQGRARGLCASVMLKCQNYTMKQGVYDSDNALLSEYIARTAIIIKKNRAAKVNEYASTCLGDVMTCINTNGGGAQNGMFSDYAINSCHSVITTCKSLTDGGADGSLKKWLQDVVYVANNNVSSDNNDDYDPIKDVPDAVLGINDYHEVTAEELEIMRQEDIAACQKISGAKVSESGALCIIHGINESISKETMLEMAKKAVAAYGGVVVFGVDNNRGYSETFAKFPYFNARMYMMRFAYYQAKTECENRGGSLNIALGDFRESPQCGNVPVVNEEECTAFRSDAPAPYTYELQSHYDASTGMCRYLARGMYFYSREIPGQCSAGATENALGDCEF